MGGNGLALHRTVQDELLKRLRLNDDQVLSRILANKRSGLHLPRQEDVIKQLAIGFRQRRIRLHGFGHFPVKVLEVIAHDADLLEVNRMKAIMDENHP
ncbi:hypothetical protein D3C72_1705840 [compost metagenome]